MNRSCSQSAQIHPAAVAILWSLCVSQTPPHTAATTVLWTRLSTCLMQRWPQLSLCLIGCPGVGCSAHPARHPGAPSTATHSFPWHLAFCPASASAVVTFHTGGPIAAGARLCSHDKVATLGTETRLNPSKCHLSHKNTSPCGSVRQDPSASLWLSLHLCRCLAFVRWCPWKMPL